MPLNYRDFFLSERASKVNALYQNNKIIECDTQISCHYQKSKSLFNLACNCKNFWQNSFTESQVRNLENCCNKILCHFDNGSQGL